MALRICITMRLLPAVCWETILLRLSWLSTLVSPQLRFFFRRKNKSGFALFLWGLGAALAVAPTSTIIPEDVFYLAYAAFVLAGIWSIGAFWYSDFLSINRQNHPKSYRWWGFIVTSLFAGLTISCVTKTYTFQ
ncbi:hypothetical protein, partial [Terracidiphilus sp.]|uniref:hypothetical protein n=1 Tax=Terracidiphilus sp. TaxID=1964191 RepID=UPI003C1BF29D